MSDRLLVLAVAAGVGVLLLLVYTIYRRLSGAVPEWLDIDELGLELMSGCCAFVVFTTPACRPCKAVLRIVRGAAERSGGLTEVTTVDAMEHVDLTIRYGVRTIPTTFLITASGHVIARWTHVPDPSAVEAALGGVDDRGEVRRRRRRERV
jgi:hypothetical protein